MWGVMGLFRGERGGYDPFECPLVVRGHSASIRIAKSYLDLTLSSLFYIYLFLTHGGGALVLLLNIIHGLKFKFILLNLVGLKQAW